MTRPVLHRWLGTLTRWLRRDSGSATAEFVIMVPVIMAIFMASFENGLLMTREVMLEQSVDMTMRELRLGKLGTVTNAKLKTEICSRTIIFPDCEKVIKVQLDRVSTTTWTMPTSVTTCANVNSVAEPVVTMNAGQQNDLMLVRVCASLPAIFPGLYLGMPMDALGNYRLLARSAFVVEPT